MSRLIEVTERLHGNWSCKMSDWPALGEFIDVLQRGESWSIVVSHSNTHVGFVSGDGTKVAVEDWGPKGFDQFMGVEAEAASTNVRALELERNEDHPEDGTWLIVPAELMLTTTEAVGIVVRMAAGEDVPFTVVPR